MTPLFNVNILCYEKGNKEHSRLSAGKMTWEKIVETDLDDYDNIVSETMKLITAKKGLDRANQVDKILVVYTNLGGMK
jgi:N-acyl-D-aspartate/D-glutamate deacylase